MTNAVAIAQSTKAPNAKAWLTSAQGGVSRAGGHKFANIIKPLRRVEHLQRGLVSGACGSFKGAIDVRLCEDVSALSGSYLVLDAPVVIDGRPFSELHLGYRGFVDGDNLTLSGRVQIACEEGVTFATLSYISLDNEPRYLGNGKWASAAGDSLVKLADTSGLADGNPAFVILVDLIHREAHVGWEGGPVRRHADPFHGFTCTADVHVPTEREEPVLHFDARGRPCNSQGELLRKVGQSQDSGRFGTSYYLDESEQKVYALVSSGKAMPEVTFVVQLPLE